MTLYDIIFDKLYTLQGRYERGFWGFEIHIYNILYVFPCSLNFYKIFF